MNSEVIKKTPVLYGEDWKIGAEYVLISRTSKIRSNEYMMGIKNGNISDGLRGNYNIKTKADAIKWFDKEVFNENLRRKNISLGNYPDDLLGFSKEYWYERNIIKNKLIGILDNPECFIHGGGIWDSFIILTNYIPSTPIEMCAGPGNGLHNRGAIWFSSLNEMVKKIQKKLEGNQRG